MSKLAEWNHLPEADAITPLLACCGSSAFATAIMRARPYPDLNSLLAKGDEAWWSLQQSDWLEAFACHPRIGEAPANGSHQFSAWSTEEQSKARTAAESVLDSIAQKNREYEARHGFIYIVCASGKSAEELLAILDRRLQNITEVEIREAAEQQRQITHLRIRKWLTP
jgi:2-oxo-4-hydroxy-4-carboxy-5-ureidoimidazoline decarboxylase